MSRHTGQPFNEVEMGARIARNLKVPAESIRYKNSGEPGQFREVGPRWEISYRGQWREIPWHFDGPLSVTMDLIEKWYG